MNNKASYKGNIINIAVKDLKPYPKNSRKHPEQQIKMLMKSIADNGFTTTLVVDEHNTVLSGHGRLDAAKRLCIESLPCNVVSGWTDTQKRAYVISDNQSALLSTWDNDFLEAEILDIANEGFDVELLGFDDKFLTKLFDDTAGIKIDDEIDELFEGEIKIMFPEHKRIDVMNAIADAIKEISGAQIWCDSNEQV